MTGETTTFTEMLKDALASQIAVNEAQAARVAEAAALAADSRKRVDDLAQEVRRLAATLRQSALKAVELMLAEDHDAALAVLECLTTALDPDHAPDDLAVMVEGLDRFCEIIN